MGLTLNLAWYNTVIHLSSNLIIGHIYWPVGDIVFELLYNWE